MTPKDYVRILPYADIAKQYRQEFVDIFNDPNSKIQKTCPSYMRKKIYEPPHTQWLEYTIDCPDLDYNFFFNSNSEQFILFRLHHDTNPFCIYKRLIENHEFIAMPHYLWSHAYVDFTGVTRLPPEIQNFLLLR